MTEHPVCTTDLSDLDDESLVLVAIMPSPRDLEIARVLGWYRIPLKYAPKIVYVDYLAFYQPSAFGEDHKNCIELIASVRGIELTTRNDLFHNEPDHPRANEEYYKIQIGALKVLPHPVRANKWKRITFLYTTGAYLKVANIINDLVVKDHERKILWRSLRERGEKFKADGENQTPDLMLDKQMLMMLGKLNQISDVDALYLEF